MVPQPLGFGAIACWKGVGIFLYLLTKPCQREKILFYIILAYLAGDELD